MGKNVSNLIYFSELNFFSKKEQIIENILSISRSNNISNNVTGVLIATKKYFIQYIEGEYEQLTSLYDKIATDKRHKNVTILHEGTLLERKFPKWTMGFKNLENTTLDFGKDLSLTGVEKEMFNDLISEQLKTKIGFDFNTFIEKLMILEDFA